MYRQCTYGGAPRDALMTMCGYASALPGGWHVSGSWVDPTICEPWWDVPSPVNVFQIQKNP